MSVEEPTLDAIREPVEQTDLISNRSQFINRTCMHLLGAISRVVVRLETVSFAPLIFD